MDGLCTTNEGRVATGECLHDTTRDNNVDNHYRILAGVFARLFAGVFPGFFVGVFAGRAHDDRMSSKSLQEILHLVFFLAPPMAA